MKVSPLAQGQGVSQPQSGRTEGQAKAAAISKFMGNTPQSNSQNPTGIANPTAVAPEEFMAIPKANIPDISDSVEDTEVQVAGTPHDPAQAPTEEPTKVDPLSSQYAMLARKEKALRAKQQQMEQSIKQREEALKARESELLTKNTQQDMSSYISKDKIKQQTLQVLAEAGVSYDELTQQILNQTPTDPRTEAHISRLEAQIKKLEEANETSQKSQTKQQQDAYEAAVRQIRTDAKKLVHTDPSYEMIKSTGSVNDVVDLIEKTYAQDGIVLSVEDAAAEVEEYLAEEAVKLARLSKIQNRLKPVAKATTNSNVQSPQTPKQQQPMKTLTNASASSRPLSARERAMLRFKGEQF